MPKREVNGWKQVKWTPLLMNERKMVNEQELYPLGPGLEKDPFILSNPRHNRNWEGFILT